MAQKPQMHSLRGGNLARLEAGTGIIGGHATGMIAGYLIIT